MKTYTLRSLPALAGAAALLGGSTRAQTTTLESRTIVAANASTTESCISADGRFVAFMSSASDIVAGDTNGVPDIFVYDATTGTRERVSVATSGVQADSTCEFPSISSDGRFVAFDSASMSLVVGDANGTTDVFLRDRLGGTTELVSVATGGAQGNDVSYGPSVSADGRYVAFWSAASNLVPGDTNANYDIFVRDRQSGTTERVSVATGGGEANGGSFGPAISADGRYVAFSSDATNLVAGDANGWRDVFVHDRQTGTTVRASVGFGGIDSNGGSYSPVGISSDGRYVCFQSDASNLVPTDGNGHSDVFVRDLLSGTTEIASLGAGGVQGNTNSFSCAMTPDGRFVVFLSTATNLVAGDTNGMPDIFVRDRQTGSTLRASVGEGGVQGDQGAENFPGISADGGRVAFLSDATNLVAGDGNASTDVFLRELSSATTVLVSGAPEAGNSFSDGPAISADGSLVAFWSNSSDLVAGDTNGFYDIFASSRGGAIERVSVASGGAGADSTSLDPTVSSDGRFVAFDSQATNLVAGDTNNSSDVFLRDRQLGTTERVSVGMGGVQPNNGSTNPSISGDGRYVAFQSLATNLVAGDVNGQMDVYVRDRVTATTELVSQSTAGVLGNGFSGAPSITPDGRYVAFVSNATNLVVGDTNGVLDIFVRDRQLGTTERVSVATGGAEGNSSCYLPCAISADGRCVAFWSDATNLVAGDTNAAPDVFLRDRQTGTTERVSVSSVGGQANAMSRLPSISSDGRFVAFVSDASNLVSGDSGGYTDLFVRDRLLGRTERAGVAADGSQANGSAGSTYASSISADGRYVAFASDASNLVGGDANAATDVFLRDRGGSSFTPFCFGDGTGAACPCANSGAPGHGCENSATTGGAVLSGSGVASAVADSVHLTATGEKPTATSVLVQGNLSVNSLHYGDGLRCVAGTLKRLYTHPAVAGVVTMPQGADLSITMRSAAVGAAISPGMTRIYQIYYRDPSTTFCPSPNGSTFNITNAIAIAWGH
jgi:Tol biopolymer transport system component